MVVSARTGDGIDALRRMAEAGVPADTTAVDVVIHDAAATWWPCARRWADYSRRSTSPGTRIKARVPELAATLREFAPRA